MRARFAGFRARAGRVPARDLVELAGLGLVALAGGLVYLPLGVLLAGLVLVIAANGSFRGGD